MQIVGDGKILGVPYLPVKGSDEGNGWGPNHPNWTPDFDFRDQLTPDDREYIPFPGTEFPDYRRDEPNQRGGNGSDSGNPRKRSNAPTDPINYGGRRRTPIDLQDALGIPDWQETVWDEFVNTPGAGGGIDGTIPYEPPKPYDPPLPGPTPRGPQNNECSRGKLPHWRYGGDHTEASQLVQFRVWRIERGTPKPKNEGIEHSYFKRGVTPFLAGQIQANLNSPLNYVRVQSDDGWIQSMKFISGIKQGYPWRVTNQYRKYSNTLLWMEKRKVSIRQTLWDLYLPLPNTPGSLFKPPYSYASKIWSYAASVDCVMRFSDKPRSNYHPPKKPYNRGDEMGCQWQKDEITYQLPKLKIGDKEIGGESIKIDDGMLPFADYMCKSIEIMFKGLGLDEISRELPKDILKRGSTDAKFTPKSLGEFMDWQFNNMSGLVGAPVETAIKNIEGEEKTIPFRSVQDVISALFHQQKESDLDLWVIENYCVRMAQQLEAVTQICLKQDADIEMLVKEAGFKWTWETRERSTLYKHGMKDEDEKTGIVELFKGGKVAYPVRIWGDDYDQRQISMTTNLYAEISAKQGMFKLDPSEDLPGFAARKKMKKQDEESWREYVKTINSPSQAVDGQNPSRVVSGMSVPFIEEYTKGTVTSKKVDEPKSGLSLFQKKPTPKQGK